MNTSPQPLHIVCEIPVNAALDLGATNAGRFAHLLSLPDIEKLRAMGLLDAAKPYITLDPDSHAPALVVGAQRATLVSVVDNIVAPALRRILDADLARLHEEERNARKIAAFLEETDGLATGNEPRYLERWRAGVLPQVELSAVIREAILGGSDVLTRAPRFRALQAEEFHSMRRAQACSVVGGRHGATFEIVHDVKLDPAEFEIYQGIVKAAQYVCENAVEAVGLENVSMEIVRKEHIMRCPHDGCGATMRRKSVMLTFTWAGITVGRELGLEPPK